MLKKLLRRIIRSYIAPHIPSTDSISIMAKSSRFVACEMIEGDYLEFGVYKGNSFTKAYYWLNKEFRSRIKLTIGGENELDAKLKRKQIWDEMRFFAFDSFEGLPELSDTDKSSADFQKGQYAYSENNFLKSVTTNGIPKDRIHTIRGFFSDTCNKNTLEKHNIKKASIIWLDADLYSSTVPVLEFITPLLQDGTILIFDDWFSFKGSPYQGVQKAFFEWKEELTNKFYFHEYQRDSWKRMSFIVSKRI